MLTSERRLGKRIFVVKASQSYIDCSMRSTALAPYGRLDVVARAAIAALSTRKGPRRDTIFYAVLEGRKPKVLALKLNGEKLTAVPSSEAEFGELLRLLACGATIEGAELLEMRFADLVTELARIFGKENVYYMHEEGTDISAVKVGPSAVFVLGDHVGVDAQSEEWLRSLGIGWVSLGSRSYFTEHVITFIHALMDGYIPSS